MSRRRIWAVFSTALWLMADFALAEDVRQAVAAEVQARTVPHSSWFLIRDPGVLELLPWLGIVLWGVLAVPLGILSIVHSARSRVDRWPLATKLLVVGGVWVFILGLTGLVQELIYAFLSMATAEAGAAASCMLASNIGRALYAMFAALCVCHVHLLFLLISVIVLHRKTRALTATGSTAR